MNKKALRADLLLLLTAGIWGFGFVAQRSGMEYIGPFAFNGIRFILGSLSLLPLILIRRSRSAAGTASMRHLLLPSLAAGGCLFVAVIFQQFGIIFTTAGNAGFITGLYVVLTPIFGIFLGRKTGLPTWVGSVLTLTGLYFISAAGSAGSVNPGDIIIVISAFFWAAHVLLIDHLMRIKVAHNSAEKNLSIDPVELSSGQFAVCGVLSMIGAILAEPHTASVVEQIDPSLLDAGLFQWLPFPALAATLTSGSLHLSMEMLIPILYGGLCSVGIAYTLQVVAQRDAPPAHATIILCFEGCFAALGGVLLLSEKIGLWTLLGFIFMLAGMIATQWDIYRGASRRGAGKKIY
ncbi:MAG: DMT family transporter [Treponema sp.]|nr:DMT family transporter [Treponema sp.]